GIRVQVLDRYQTWSLVSVSGYVGYAYNAYLRFEEDAAPTATPTPTATPAPTATPQTALRAVVSLSDADETLNLREAPTLEARVIALLPDGMVLDVIERYQNWSRVRAAGQEGYVSNDYLRFETYVPGT